MRDVRCKALMRDIVLILSPPVFLEELEGGGTGLGGEGSGKKAGDIG